MKIWQWLLILAVIGFGMMLLIKIPALGLSEAGFCGQCHVMDDQVDAYLHSSHANAANCGDCHDPDALVTGSMFAAYVGARDVYRVVTNTAPLEIKTTDLSKKVIQENCMRCHGDIMVMTGNTSDEGGSYCFHCHRNIVHPNK